MAELRMFVLILCIHWNVLNWIHPSCPSRWRILYHLQSRALMRCESPARRTWSVLRARMACKPSEPKLGSAMASRLPKIELDLPHRAEWSLPSVQPQMLAVCLLRIRARMIVAGQVDHPIGGGKRRHVSQMEQTRER